MSFHLPHTPRLRFLVLQTKAVILEILDALELFGKLIKISEPHATLEFVWIILESDLRTCISDKFLGDADVADWDEGRRIYFENH